MQGEIRRYGNYGRMPCNTAKSRNNWQCFATVCECGYVTEVVENEELLSDFGGDR
jgi:hypothetical protein